MGEASLALGQLVPQKRNDLVLTLAETGEVKKTKRQKGQKDKKRQKDKKDRKTSRQKLVPQKRNYLVHCQRLRLIETDSTHLQLLTVLIAQLKFREKGEHTTGEDK